MPTLGLDVVLIEKAAGPLLAALGKELAPCWAELHRRHGVDLRLGVGVDAFVGNGQVKAVRLTDGSKLPADLVVIGLGVNPTTDWLEGSGLWVDDGISAMPPALPKAGRMSSPPVMSHAGGIRFMGAPCVSSIGTTPDVRAQQRLGLCLRDGNR